MIIDVNLNRFGFKTGARNGGNRRKWARKGIRTVRTPEEPDLLPAE